MLCRDMAIGLGVYAVKACFKVLLMLGPLALFAPDKSQAAEPLSLPAKWKTTARMVIDAATAKQAIVDGKSCGGGIWINSDGSHSAYIHRKGKQMCFVIDGKAEHYYDDVYPCNLFALEVFFGGGKHYAYAGPCRLTPHERGHSDRHEQVEQFAA